MSNTALRSVALLFFAGFVAYAYNNAFMALSPLYVVELGGTMVDAGLQGSVFMVTAIALRLLFGPLADRHGAKPVMVFGLSAFAASGFLMALCDQIWCFVVLRCVQSVGLAAFFPCATALVAVLVPEGKTGFCLGLYRFVSSASLLFGPSLAFALVGGGGFRWGFCFMGLFALIAGFAVLGISAKRSKSFETTDAAGRAGLSPQRESNLRRDERSLVRILKETVTRAPLLVGGVLGATFVAALGYGLLFGFAAPYIAGVLPDINSGLYFALMGVGGLAANPLAGWMSDRAPRMKILAVLFVSMGAGIVALGFLPWGCEVLFASGFLVGFGYFGSMTTVLAIIAARISDELRSSVLSLQQNGIDLGIACASGGFGFVFSFVDDAVAVFAFQGALTVLLGLGMLFMSHARCGKA